jgi:hypothetical protein
MWRIKSFSLTSKFRNFFEEEQKKGAKGVFYFGTEKESPFLDVSSKGNCLIESDDVVE